MRDHPPLTITEQARDKIVAMTKELKTRVNREVIPAVLWLDSKLNEGGFASHPTIGFYYDRSEVEGDIIVFDGLSLVLAVSDQDRALHFEGKTLHYDGERFVLLS